jgi:ABC-type transport system involved in multi-copper enzyme maturation permease subunit
VDRRIFLLGYSPISLHINELRDNRTRRKGESEKNINKQEYSFKHRFQKLMFVGSSFLCSFVTSTPHLNMKMTFMTILFLLMSAQVMLSASSSSIYNKLNQVIEDHAVYTHAREKQLRDLKIAARYNKNNPETLLKIYDDEFTGYYAYNYDSAMVYVKRTILLARKTGNEYYLVKSTLHRALLLASVGFYDDSEECLKSVSARNIPHDLLFDYYYTHYKLYSFWNNYYKNSEFSEKMNRKIIFYLRNAISLVPKNSNMYFYLLGEYYKLKHHIYFAGICCKKVVDRTSQNDKLYGSAAYNLADCYLQEKKYSQYRHYLILAAIGDIKCSVKENVALQDLAMFIFNNQKDQLQLAEKYITFSMRDAKSYNSRLRMIEISRKLPAIVSTYQDKLFTQNKYLRMGILLLALLALALFTTFFYIIQQNKLLTISKKKVSNSYEVLRNLNKKINFKNQQLLGVNTKREKLAKVYIDLCAKYIDKLQKFQKLVERKIRANQAKDLLSQISSSKLSDEEANTFLSQFDHAFLSLYPSFVNELNSLLKDDCHIKVKSDLSMTTELRVFALIRLGVKDSAEIAGILFYSPQTIYNYRWGLKCQAKNKDTFENDVVQLCKFG